MTKEFFTELDLSDSRVRGYAAGLRPFRRSCPRLEVEKRGSKVIGHNYGHGGSGITMSWGSAAEILDLLAPHLSSGLPVGVLGAGVMGLCTATLLQQRGHQVTLYTRDLPPHTTSNVAGGLWAPTHVGLGVDPVEAERHERMLRRSWEMFRALNGERFGVDLVPMFEADDARDRIDAMPEGLIEPARRMDRLPFPGDQPGGKVQDTLMIETTRFLRVLFEQVREAGGEFRTVEFQSPDELEALEESVLVNCLGLGASAVTGDPDLLPIKGQLVLLEPAPRMFMLDHRLGYVISRRDVLILGGTFEEGESQPGPVPERCHEILTNHRQYFTKS
jgi:D-amino-acid oxidase